MAKTSSGTPSICMALKIVIVNKIIYLDMRKGIKLSKAVRIVHATLAAFIPSLKLKMGFSIIAYQC